MNDLKQILKEIYNAPAQVMSCTEFSAMIPAVVELENQGKNISEAYPDLFTHLEICPDCEEVYSDLKFALSEEAMHIEMPATDAAFDLGFFGISKGFKKNTASTLAEAAKCSESSRACENCD